MTSPPPRARPIGNLDGPSGDAIPERARHEAPPPIRAGSDDIVPLNADRLRIADSG